MHGMLIARAVTEACVESAAIRYFSNGNVSHMDLEMPNGTLLGARIHGGVRERPHGYAKFTFIQRMSVWVPDLDAAHNFARAQIGKPYNWRALVNMGMHRKRKFTMDQKSWFCDELVYAAAMAGGLHLLKTRNPFNLTPYEVTLSPCWTYLPGGTTCA